MKKRCSRLILGMILLLLAGCGSKTEAVYDLSAEEGQAYSSGSSMPDKTESAGTAEQAETVVVYVCGAVADPGVYTLPAGSRAFEAVDAAGGFLPEAASDHLNLAQQLKDGQQIIVYTVDQVTMQATGTAGSSGVNASGKVNLNFADKEQLMTLPGIGETRAEAILEYRQTHGSFAAPEEIQQISGIKKKLFDKIKDFIEI